MANKITFYDIPLQQGSQNWVLWLCMHAVRLIKKLALLQLWFMASWGFSSLSLSHSHSDIDSHMLLHPEALSPKHTHIHSLVDPASQLRVLLQPSFWNKTAAPKKIAAKLPSRQQLTSKKLH